MRVNNEMRELCAHNLVVMIVDELKEYFPNKSKNYILAEFSSSKTYEMLFDFGTGFWGEGPSYIKNIYLEEIGLRDRL